jgi:hypothetical protein
MPDVIDNLQRKLTAKSIEAEVRRGSVLSERSNCMNPRYVIFTWNCCLQGLKRETDRSSIDRRKALLDQIKAMEDEMKTLTQKWEGDRARLQAGKNATQQLEAARFQLQLAEVCVTFMILLILLLQMDVMFICRCYAVLSAKPRVGQGQPDQVQ